jgi:hypothetical protein
MIDKYLVQTILSLDLQTPTDEQQKALVGRYNTSVGYELQYAKLPTYGETLYVFAMPSKSFGSFEYYMAMEYERDNIAAKLQTPEGMMIAYNSQSDRAVELWNMLTGEDDQSSEDENDWDR